MGLHVAFFRFINLGQPGSPTGAQLVAAFGGAQHARSFQTNGTVIFSATAPVRALRMARKRLAADGFEHPVLVRSAAQVRALLIAVPEAHPDEAAYRTLVSFYDGAAWFDPTELVKTETLDIRQGGPGFAGSVCWRSGTRSGDPTRVLEAKLGVPVTTRTRGTVSRLVAALAVAELSPEPA